MLFRSAEAVTDDDGAFMMRFVQQNREVIDPSVEFAVILNACACAMPPQIGRQQFVRRNERSLLNKLAPARVVACQAVQQDDRVTGDDQLRNQRAASILYSHARCR